MAKSSINFMPVTSGAFKHNDRTDKPSHLIDDVSRNMFNIDAKRATLILKSFLKKARINYKEHTGQTLQAKSFLWEAVVNINEEHCLSDLERLAEAIEDETGFTMIQIALHKDEGHVHKHGKNDYNLHAHIDFFTLDRTSGKQLYRRDIPRSIIKKLKIEIEENYKGLDKNDKKALLKKTKQERYGDQLMNVAKMSKLQGITAQVLGMERGKEGSKAQRYSSKQYRAIKKAEEAKNEELLKTKKMLKTVEDEIMKKNRQIGRLSTENTNLLQRISELETRMKRQPSLEEHLELENNFLKVQTELASLKNVKLHIDRGEDEENQSFKLKF